MKKEVTITEMRTICDTCARDMPPNDFHYICSGCGKDLCSACVVTVGDVHAYCNRCLEISKPHRERLGILEDNYDQECNAIQRELDEACRRGSK